MLELPDGVEVVSATTSAGHLSSSSIYPACFAPYLISTACSDGCVRFWTCKVEKSLDEKGVPQAPKYEWEEWDMMIRTEESSAIHVMGKFICLFGLFHLQKLRGEG